MVSFKHLATVDISSSRLTVMIHGEDVNLPAEDKGNAVLSGTSTYSVEKDGISSVSARWAAVPKSTGEAGEEPTETEEDTQE